MNKSFLFWLGRLSRYIARTKERHIPFIIYNCFDHGYKALMPDFENVEVFFRPNNTSRRQLLDAGTIAQVKGKCRSHMMLKVFDNIDAGNKSIYNIENITAMRWASEEWNDLSTTCISIVFGTASDLWSQKETLPLRKMRLVNIPF